MAQKSVRTAQNAPVPMLDFRRQYAGLRDEMLTRITAVCDSQQFVLGPEVEQFERAAAEKCDARFGVGCSSGTDALWLSLVAAGVLCGALVGGGIGQHHG